jgi:acyl-CoA dehydrogenase
MQIENDRSQAAAGADTDLLSRVDSLCRDVFLPIVQGWDDHEKTCRPLIEAMADAGLFGLTIPAAYGGAGGSDKYSTVLCYLRERFGYHEPLIDTQFAIQGLGTNAILRMGTDAQHARYLPGLVSGKTLFSFALTEPHSGSDVLGMRTRARRDGDDWILNGSKMFISGAPDADVYITFAKTGAEEDRRAVTAFLIDNGTAGFTARGGIHLQAPHAIGYLDFDDCRISDAQRLGEVGEGLRACLGTLEIFRPSVGAATLGMAAKALDLAVAFSKTREAFGGHLADLPGLRLKLGRMAALIEGGRGLVQRAAGLRDSGSSTVVEGALAKAFSTEASIDVIYEGQQIHGGRGVIVGEEIEMLSRAVRPTTIYEGASEVQRTIIGKAEARRLRKGEASRAPARGDGPLGALLAETRATYDAWLAASEAQWDAPAFHVRLAESLMAIEAAECAGGAATDVRQFLALAAARTLAAEVARTGGATSTVALADAARALGAAEDDLALQIAASLLN